VSGCVADRAGVFAEHCGTRRCGFNPHLTPALHLAIYISHLAFTRVTRYRALPQALGSLGTAYARVF
jgi:hypothetical protein